MWGTKCLIHRVGEATEDSGPEYKSLKWKCYKEISKIAQEEEREGEMSRSHMSEKGKMIMMKMIMF